MSKIDSNFKLRLPKTICQALNWECGDKIESKLFDEDLLVKLVSGEIKIKNKKMPIILINCEDEKLVKRNRTIFD